MGATITIENAVKRYGNDTIINGLCLEVKPGEFFTLLGPSGCGKTTLLRMIIGFNSIEGGTFKINDRVINDIPTNKRNIGMVFQNYAVFPHMNVFDNVAFGLRNRKLPKDEIERKVNSILKVVKIDHLKDRMPANLSGGQQQRVALARILSSEPEAILLDEPFSALDSYLKWNLELELADLLAGFGGPVLWVSHDLGECYRNCRSVCVMEDGKTGAVTGMDEMIRHPESVSAARLAGCKNFLAAVEKNGAVYLPEWGMALPVDAKGKTFTTLGIPDHAVALSDGGALRCTLCRVISGVEQDILLLRPEHCGEGAPALRVSAARGNSLRAGETVCVALDAEKLLLL